MKIAMKKLAAFVALSLGLGIAACAEQSPTATELTVDNAPAYTTISSGSAKFLQRVKDGDYNAGEWIGIEGGTVSLYGNHLIVPAGAVSGKTWFEARLVYDDVIRLKLTATSEGSTVTNNVGSAGFAKDLTLSLRYDYATNVPADPTSMRAAWNKGDGTLEVQPSTVDTAEKRVNSLLKHFSEYVVVYP